MNKLLSFHPPGVFFFSQAGLTGPLQKEELQLGVDAANSAAQQYQRSKDQQKLLQQSNHRCDQKDETAQYLGLCGDK